MKYTIFLASLFGAGVLTANNKVNQYHNLDDCRADRNIISHHSPALGGCNDVEGPVAYLVVGGGNAGAKYYSWTQQHCQGDRLGGVLQTGQCITLPGNAKSIYLS